MIEAIILTAVVIFLVYELLWKRRESLFGKFFKNTMALHEKGNGIYASHITVQDIQEKCKALFGEKAIFGPNYHISVIETNYSSEMWLFDPVWGHVDKGVPRKFIIKVTSPRPLLELKDVVAMTLSVDVNLDNPVIQTNLRNFYQNYHSNEINAYKIIEKYGNLHLPYPKIYHMEPFTEENTNKGFFIMSYEKNYSSQSKFDNFSVEELKRPLRALAALNAISLHMTDEEKALFPTGISKTVFANLSNPVTIESLFNMVRQKGDESLSSLIDRCESIAPDLTNLEYFESIGSYFEMEPMLCHGDYLPSNLLFSRSYSGRHDFLGVINFHTAALGIPCSDICLLLGFCLSGKDRREHWENLVETYYEYLKEEVGELPMPFTMEQLKESFNRFSILGYFMAFIELVQLVLKWDEEEPTSNKQMQTHARKKRNQKEKPRYKSEKEIMRETVNGKCRCLLEDILETYQFYTGIDV